MLAIESALTQNATDNTKKKMFSDDAIVLIILKIIQRPASIQVIYGNDWCFWCRHEPSVSLATFCAVLKMTCRVLCYIHSDMPIDLNTFITGLSVWNNVL